MKPLSGVTQISRSVSLCHCDGRKLVFFFPSAVILQIVRKRIALQTPGDWRDHKVLFDLYLNSHHMGF